MDGEFSSPLPAHGLTQLAPKQITIKGESLLLSMLERFEGLWTFITVP
jgi:hypothetical protein